MTLYPVLTGEPPLTGSRDRAALLDEAPTLPPDLAAVVARCIATDPAERYPSARAVADDLQRFLDGEAVEAYADHFSYRLTRFALRHRAILTLAAVSAVLLVAALAVAAALGVQAIRANERAESRRGQAEELIRFMLLDLRDKLESVGRLELLDEVGERAMDYFAAVPEDELTDDELAQRSRALYQIGEVRMKRGDLEAAERAFAESLTQARRLSARHPKDLERLFDLGQSEFWSGFVLFRQDDFDEAKTHLQAYLDVAQRLVAEDPDRRDWLQELSYAHSNLGMVLQQEGQPAKALERFQESIRIDHQLVETATDSTEANAIRFELAASYNTVAVVLEELGRLDEALAHYRHEASLRATLSTSDPANRVWQAFLGGSHAYVGALLLVRGDLEEARRSFESAGSIFDELVRLDPDNTDWRFRQALNRLQLGRLELMESEPIRGEVLLQGALATSTDLLETNPDQKVWRHVHAQSLYGLARAHLAMNRGTDKALEFLESAAEVLQPLRPPSDWVTAAYLGEISLLRGDVYSMRGDEPAARTEWNEAFEVLSPWRSDVGGHPQVLTQWLKVTQRLGLSEEQERTRGTLGSMGIDPDDPGFSDSTRD